MYKVTNLPKAPIADYAVCPLAACKKSDTCVRFAAYLKAQADKESFHILNTSRFTPSDAGCENYLIAVKQRMARGFCRLYATLPNCNSHYFWKYVSFMNETSWYRAKRGDLLLSPEEQQILLAAFREKGADVSVGFDEYVEKEVYEKPLELIPSPNS